MDKIVVSTDKMKPSDAYVCWLDIMGTKSTMSSSFEKSANVILRFHAAVLKAQTEKVRIYPVMDGVYIATKLEEDMVVALNKIMTCLAEVFLGDSNEHRFVVRGAIAKGTIQHGSLLPKEVCQEISGKKGYKEKLLFGMPMIQACSSETMAPPFGIFIHESARIVDYLQGPYYFWQQDSTISTRKNLQSDLKKALEEFFDWEKKRHFYYDLPEAKFDEYKNRVEEYYTMIQEWQDK